MLKKKNVGTKTMLYHKHALILKIEHNQFGKKASIVIYWGVFQVKTNS